MSAAVQAQQIQRQAGWQQGGVQHGAGRRPMMLRLEQETPSLQHAAAPG